MKRELRVSEKEVGLRLDKFLAEIDEDLSRSQAKDLIDEGVVLVDGLAKKPKYILSLGEVIIYTPKEVVEVDILPVEIPINILYEDEDVLVVDKEAGMVVHPAPGHFDDTLVNAIMYHCGDSLSGINGEIRPGIVHRIDKDTSGILVICKNDMAHRALAAQFKEHSINRVYAGICLNHFKEDSGTVDAPIGRNSNNRLKMAINHKNGREAITHYELVRNLNDNFSLVDFKLETGRTHQIRVHMQSLNHPLLGDELYGPKKSPFGIKGQLLHAKRLGFIHPRSGEYVEFNSDLPERFTKVLARIDS